MEEDGRMEAVVRMREMANGCKILLGKQEETILEI
jgi:hypothetical protein